MTTLHRHIGIGEALSFDGGRIIVTIQERTGRRVALRLEMAQDVQVDKPRSEPRDRPMGASKVREHAG